MPLTPLARVPKMPRMNLRRGQGLFKGLKITAPVRLDEIREIRSCVALKSSSAFADVATQKCHNNSVRRRDENIAKNRRYQLLYSVPKENSGSVACSIFDQVVEVDLDTLRQF